MFQCLIEIRNKLILLIITFFSTFFICCGLKNELLFLITQMHLNNKNFYFIFTDISGLLIIYFKIIWFFLAQIFLFSLLYHGFSFLSTALYYSEFKFFSFFFNSGLFFFLFSNVLSSYILIPFGWNFFLSLSFQQGVYLECCVSDYFNFYYNVYVLCLIYCQFFSLIFIFLININENFLYVKKYRKLYYYVFFIFSTLITPPDVISQFSSVFLIIIAYEIVLSFFIFQLMIKKQF